MMEPRKDVSGVRAAAWLACGILLGCMVRAPWWEEAATWVRGYRWSRLGRCIVESPDTTGNGVDFCRIPVNCDICKEVREIDEIHVDDLSVELFQEKYAHSERPVVVRNVTLGWPVMEELDYYWLKRQYLRDESEMDKCCSGECWFNSYKTVEFQNLRNVFRLPDSRVVNPGARPWYVGWGVCQESVAEEILQLIQRPPFLHPDSTPPRKPWIFIGSPGPGAHTHIDNLALASWQAQIQGVKTWRLRPPPECRAACHGEIQSTLHPGDVIVVNTRLWFHGSQVHGPGLSLSLVNEFD